MKRRKIKDFIIKNEVLMKRRGWNNRNGNGMKRKRGGKRWCDRGRRIVGDHVKHTFQ